MISCCNLANGRLVYRSFFERKVRTPQGGIAGNTRHLENPRRTSATERMYNLVVVKSGKLYAVQHQVNSRLRVSRPM